jgi:signal recognition particle subunit SRP54
MEVFEGLSSRLQSAFKKIRGKGKVSPEDVKEAMREVKLALLEADVNFKVVKDFIKVVTEKATGAEVLESLTPAQQVIKVVNDEMTNLMGGTSSKINMSPKAPTVVMLVGLQGAGKTTTAAKLGGILRKQNKKPLLVACDVYRPAAIKQLQVVGKQLDIPVYAEEDNKDVVAIANNALKQAKIDNQDLVIIDTAGRLHIDEILMEELVNVKNNVHPHEILLVVDSMTGQDAVNVAETFNNNLGIDGVVLTKLDGDTRGGAALSIKAVTNKPIKFACIGEKLSDIEQFYPDRMASRILGMGDLMTLIEKAQENFDAKKAAEMEKKIMEQKFDFEDLLEQLRQVKKMGPLTQVLGMIPGMSSAIKDVKIDEREFDKMECIIKSMTIKERRNPDLFNASRKKRVAAGSGTTIQDVNKLIKQFEQGKKMMKQLGGMAKKSKLGNFKLPF